MLRIFYESVVASTILYAVACWGSRLRVADANRLNKLIRKASDVVGVELDSLMAVSERRTLSKLQTIMDNGSHPLYHTVMRHRSTFSARLIQPKCTTERHRRVQQGHSLREEALPESVGAGAKAPVAPAGWKEGKKFVVRAALLIDRLNGG
ncbi:hypothetical protein NFI96_023533 [Prochilodus magdalenae]|nr:hypothetical protein NFI96_023533 [Prochilodus magdalenae]